MRLFARTVTRLRTTTISPTGLFSETIHISAPCNGTPSRVRSECRKRTYRQFAPDAYRRSIEEAATSGSGTANSDAEPFTDSNAVTDPRANGDTDIRTLTLSDDLTCDDSYAERRAGVARAHKRAADAFADTCRKFVAVLCARGDAEYLTDSESDT